MLSRADRIRILIEQSGKSYQELESLTGIKKSSLQRYASGVTTKIPLDAIEKLAAAFRVPPAYLMGWSEEMASKAKPTPNSPQMTEGEALLLGLFRQVPEDQQHLVLQMIRAALNVKE